MQAIGIDHVNFTVRDFDESADWYARVFGFELVERDVQDGQPWGVLRSEGGRGSAMLCIYQAPNREMLDGSQRRDRKLHGFAHFALRIHDKDEWLKTIEREKLEVPYDGAIEWPHSQSWYIKDPTGYEIEVTLWADETIRFEQQLSAERTTGR